MPVAPCARSSSSLVASPLPSDGSNSTPCDDTAESPCGLSVSDWQHIRTSLVKAELEDLRDENDGLVALILARKVRRASYSSGYFYINSTSMGNIIPLFSGDCVWVGGVWVGWGCSATAVAGVRICPGADTTTGWLRMLLDCCWLLVVGWHALFSSRKERIEVILCCVIHRHVHLARQSSDVFAAADNALFAG